MSQLVVISAPRAPAIHLGAGQRVNPSNPPRDGRPSNSRPPPRQPPQEHRHVTQRLTRHPPALNRARGTCFTIARDSIGSPLGNAGSSRGTSKRIGCRYLPSSATSYRYRNITVPGLGRLARPRLEHLILGLRCSMAAFGSPPGSVHAEPDRTTVHPVAARGNCVPDCSPPVQAAAVP